MIDRPKSMKVNCEQFLNGLEALPGSEPVDSQELSKRLPASVRQHAEACANCAAALEDFAETRKALAEMMATLPEAGPWFTKRVMAAIGARENEIEERSNSVWISVRRLAPRLAAFSVLLLVLGGTWAAELRRAEQVRKQHELQPADSLFEGSPNTPLNYDIIASTYEEQP
jgi:hypothetical protein